MPAPCTACHRQSQSVCQTWSDFGFHDTLLPMALGATSLSNAKGSRHVGRKSSPPSVASSPSSHRPRVIECLVHAITASRRRVPKASDTFQKALDGFEQDVSDCDSDSSSGSSTGCSGGERCKNRCASSSSRVGESGTARKTGITSSATAELKKKGSSSTQPAAVPAKPRLIRVSRRYTVRRDVSPVDTTLPTRCRYSLGENSNRRHVRWADQDKAPADLVTVHLIRPRLRNWAPLPTCTPAKSILKDATAS